MDRPDPAAIAGAFEAARDESTELRSALRERLAPAVTDSLLERVDQIVTAVEARLLDVVDSRDAVLKDLERARSQNPNADLSERIRLHLAALNPPRLLEEVRDAASLEALPASYGLDVSALVDDDACGPAVASLAVAPDDVAALCSVVASPLGGVSSELTSFGDAFAEHAQTLNGVGGGAGKGLAAAAGIATSVATGLVPGAILFRGTRRKAARGVGNWAFAKYSGGAVAESTARVDAAYEEWSRAYRGAVADVTARSELLLLTVYARLFLELEARLASSERTVRDVSLRGGQVTLGLTPDAAGRLRSWAVETLGKIDSMLEAGERHLAVDAAEKALAYVTADPARAAVASPDAATSYAVLFARRRARGMMDVAGTAWDGGRYEEAAGVYEALLHGTALGWDAPDVPASSRAGLRLALVASTAASPYGAGLAAYPQYVAQLRSRLAEGAPSLSGEALAEDADAVAQLIRAYSQGRHDDIDVTDRLPSGVNLVDDGTGFAATMEARRAAGAVPDDLTGGFADWIRARSTPGGFMLAAVHGLGQRTISTWGSFSRAEKTSILGGVSFIIFIICIPIITILSSNIENDQIDSDLPMAGQAYQESYEESAAEDLGGEPLSNSGNQALFDYDRWGYSPRRGVNRDLIDGTRRSGYVSVPEGDLLSLRSAPSSRHGDRLSMIPEGTSLSVNGCLPPRPEDNGRWCRTSYGGRSGWIYDIYLTASPPRSGRSGPGVSVPGGVAYRGTTDRGETYLAIERAGYSTVRSREFSPSTRVGSIRHRRLAGRSVLAFEADDGRWATTYYWDYGRGELHFYGRDRTTGDVNVSDDPGSGAVLRAALGRVPRQTFVPSEPAPDTRQATTGPTQSIVIMGSYLPSDREGLRARERVARRTGYSIRVEPSRDQGIDGPYLIIYAGPYNTEYAENALSDIRRTVPDAFMTTVD